MANYKPNAKGIIARDTVIPPRSKLQPMHMFFVLGVAILIIVPGLILFAFSDIFMWILGTTLIVIGIACIVLFFNDRFGRDNPFAIRHKNAARYLELDKIINVDIAERKVRRVGRRYTRTYIYYDYTITFESRKIFKIKYFENFEPYNVFPTMKNRENIPYHDTAIRSLVAGDECYMLFREGEDKILDIFDCKYYIPSAVDFVQYGERYYLAK